MIFIYLLFIYLGQVNISDLRNLGWAVAIFSGYGVKVAFEVSEKIKNKEPLTKLYWLGQVCSIFITFVVGYYSRGGIRTISDNADIQAGLFAIVGAVGFELFRIFYRIVTNRRLWEQFVGVLMNRYSNSPYQTPNGNPDEPSNH